MGSGIPRATYRLQFGFTFDDAAAIVPYLKKLGITHLAVLSARTSTRPGIARSGLLEQEFQKRRKRDTLRVKSHFGKTAN